MSLLIAIAKGRLIEEILPMLAQTPFALDEKAMKSRALRIPTATAGVEVILLKSADLPRYVADGIAALGVVGSDTLDECDAELLELADLRLGACRLSLCAEAGIDLEGLRRKHHLRLATKYLRSTAIWLQDEQLTAELVPLQSSVELAPVLGLADAIVDLVQTGGTLKAHGLNELVAIRHTSARLVASRGAWLSEPDRITPLVRLILQSMKI